MAAQGKTGTCFEARYLQMKKQELGNWGERLTQKYLQTQRRMFFLERHCKVGRVEWDLLFFYAGTAYFVQVRTRRVGPSREFDLLPFRKKRRLQWSYDLFDPFLQRNYRAISVQSVRSCFMEVWRGAGWVRLRFHESVDG